MSRRTVALIYPQRLRHNLSRVRALAPASEIICCIKADGYGHGATTVADALAEQAQGFAVASLEEALALREHGVGAPLLLLEGLHAPGDWPRAAMHALTVCVTDPAQLDWLRAEPPRQPLHCWIKLDTGMHRLGFDPESIDEVLAQLRQVPAIAPRITLFTHFSSADADPPREAEAQLARFFAATAPHDLPRSAANSAAILALPAAHLDVVRPGYMLYGGSPFATRSAADCQLQPAMSFRSQVIALRTVAPGERVGYGGRWQARRQSLIATVAAGYGDGYPRHAPDGTPVWVGGQRATLAGRVSMDMITVDVTDLPGVAVGTEVELWGDHVPVDTVAAAAGTIGYELLAGMPARVPRRIIE